MKATIQMLILMLLGISIIEAQQYTISTFAGGGLPVNIPGTSASLGGTPSFLFAEFDRVFGIATDPVGNCFIASSTYNVVVRLDATTGILTLVAGNGTAGFSGDNGPATSAQLNDPRNVTVDSSGNLYIADAGNARIRKVSNGVITTIAGNGTYGFSGDNGPATSAQLSGRFEGLGIAVDSKGNLYIADFDNSRVRKVSSGVITTVAGNGTQGFSGDNGPATNAQLMYPTAVAVDATGNLYIADVNGQRIRRVSNGVITSVAGNGTAGFSGDSGPATSAQLSNPDGVAVDSAGNLYIADSNNSRIRKVSNGVITTVAGSGMAGFSGDNGSATSAALYFPQGIAVDATGSFFIADTGSRRVRKVSNGVITTIAGGGESLGDNGSATVAQFSTPVGVAVDAGGSLYVADVENNRIRKVSNGVITTVVGSGTSGGACDQSAGVAVDTAGDLYSVSSGTICVVSNGVITTIASGLEYPHNTTVDSAGNLYVADVGNNRVVKVSNDVTTTVAGGGSSLGDHGPATSAKLSNPHGVAVDSAGNVYIADTGNSRIRMVSNGTITTVVGNGTAGFSGDNGPATSAELSAPTDIVVDTVGNLYIADSVFGRIRKVSKGVITTIAGGGSSFGDNGPATSAQLSSPESLAVDLAGNVYIADTGNQRIRVLTPSSSSSCTYSLSSTLLQAPAGGGNLNLTLTTTAGCAWSISDLPDWISVSGPTSGSGSATLSLIVAANSGPPHSVQISVAGIAVTVNQASNLLLVSAGGVVNDASYTAPVAPGSIAAIFGNFLLAAPVSDSSFPLSTSLDGLSFQFSGAPLAPLFYANFGQVNAQVPWELADQSQATITATNGSQTSTPEPVSIATYAPGIFTLIGGGTGQGAILGANNQLANSTNPAVAGSTVVQIFCTGLGPVTNQPQTGVAAPTEPLSQTTTPPRVMMGGAPAQVQFSGLAPGYVGLYQVNALVPQAATKGNAVPVVISIGGVQSNTVTIAVQ
jgi:trimeric autotransporter adhesin